MTEDISFEKCIQLVSGDPSPCAAKGSKVTSDDVILEERENVDAKARTELGWLIGARLLLAGLSLGLAVTLDRIEAFEAGVGIWGVYWTVAGAFLATIVSGLMVNRTANPARFATLQVVTDLTIVTSLVYFSGGGESVFSQGSIDVYCA